MRYQPLWQPLGVLSLSLCQGSVSQTFYAHVCYTMNSVLKCFALLLVYSLKCPSLCHALFVLPFSFYPASPHLAPAYFKVKKLPMLSCHVLTL